MRVAVAGLLILAAVFAAYWPVRQHAFVGMDDPDYVTQNDRMQSGLTLENVRWAFTATDLANWHPLTWLSHMLDWELFGEHAGGHLLMNVALHAVNALLLLTLLHMLMGNGAFWPCAAVALLWAVHPLRVESVAWVSERKDLLSALFGLLSLLAYGWYARKPSMARGMLVAIALALGLMCKPMLVTWPFLMLLLDIWPLRRTRLWRDASIVSAPPPQSFARLIAEKIPLFLIIAASCVVTMIAQRAGGTVASMSDVGLGTRLANAAIAYVQYLSDTFWPTGLAVFYPYPSRWPAFAVIGSAALLAAITIVAAALWRRMPWLLVGWLWFLGVLIPVIGLVQIGSQSRADRYTYLPQIGVLIAVIWTVCHVLRSRLAMFVILVIAAGFALWAQTRHQVGFWRNSDVLYARALAVTQDNWVIEHHAAARARERGDRAAEERHRRRALNARPDSTLLLASLAEFVLQQGNFHEAIRLFDEALRHDPNDPTLLNNQAWLLATAPDARVRNAKRAEDLARRACERVDHQSRLYPGYLDTLAAAQAADGRFDDALVTATAALDLAIAQEQSDLAQRIAGRIRMYQAKQPPR